MYVRLYGNQAFCSCSFFFKIEVNSNKEVKKKEAKIISVDKMSANSFI